MMFFVGYIAAPPTIGFPAAKSVATANATPNPANITCLLIIYLFELRPMMAWRADLVAHWVDRLHIGLRGIRQKLNYGCKILLPMCDKKQAAWAAKSRDEGDRRAVRTHSDVNQLAFLRDVLRRKSVQPHALRREDGGTPYARARAPVRSSKSG